MNLYLFSGFLGSGKTTLVTTLTKHMFSMGKKVMLIVNDVGDVGIDASLMRKLDTDVYEIFGGCICGQISNLMPILQKVGTEYDVDMIMLEASGIAQPNRFVETIRSYGPQDMKIKVITLVDVTRWFDLKQVLEDLLISQLESGDLILINKIDAVTEKEKNDLIQDIENYVDDVPLISLSVESSDEVIKKCEVIMNV